MDTENVSIGDIVHVYDPSGGYLGTAVYCGDVSICDMLAGEDMSEYLVGKEFFDYTTFHLRLVGSDEDLYGVECSFDTLGPSFN